MGGSKFLPYNGYTNNCQDFIMGILKGNSLGNPTIYKFVKQNTSSIFKNNPVFAGIQKFVTDLGAKFNILREGAGLSAAQKKRYSSWKYYRTPEFNKIWTEIMHKERNKQNG